MRRLFPGPRCQAPYLTVGTIEPRKNHAGFLHAFEILSRDDPGLRWVIVGSKGWLYEGGIREPMIIRAPGLTKAGSVCSVPVTSTDFYPTMLELAGLPGEKDALEWLAAYAVDRDR